VSTGVKGMNDLMIYVCLALSVISIMMMIDIKEKFRSKRDFFIHVVLMMSMIIIMWSIIECI
jgi:hypothetical protein